MLERLVMAPPLKHPAQFCLTADTFVSKPNHRRGPTVLEAAKKLGSAGWWKRPALWIIMIGNLTATHGLMYDAVKVRAMSATNSTTRSGELTRKKFMSQVATNCNRLQNE
jgi:hypothetical protein